MWSSGSAEERGAVPEAASGGSSDTQEDSTLSAYDNLDRESLRQRMEDVNDGHLETTDAGGHLESGEELAEAWHTVDSSSSWSSCEFLPLDKSGDDVGPDVTPKTRLPSSQDAGEEHKHDRADGDECDDHPPNSPASCSVLSTSLLSTGSSEVFLPSGDPDLQGPDAPSQPRDAPSLLAELQQLMAQQKAEYQARIHR